MPHARVFIAEREREGESKVRCAPRIERLRGDWSSIFFLHFVQVARGTRETGFPGDLSER